MYTEWQNIFNKHKQPGTVSLLRTYEKSTKKFAKAQCDLIFLKRCRNERLTPHFLRRKKSTLLGGKHTQKAIKECNIIIVKARIRDTRHDINFHKNQLDLISTNLLSCFSYSTYREIINIGKDLLLYYKAKTTSLHNHKLHQLKLEQNNIEPAKSTSLSDNIVNLSTYQLTQEETEALGKGLNFCFGIKDDKDAITDTILSFENALSMTDNYDTQTQLTEEDKNKLREKLKYAIHKYSNKKQLINQHTKKTQQVIQNLRNNQNIHIIKADKGNSTVIMNRSDYNTKMKKLLDDGPYKKIKYNPTKIYRKRVQDFCSQLLQQGKLEDNQCKSLSSNNDRTPIIYGAPKIHKNDIPLRPIVSSYSSPTQKLSKFIHGILKPLVGNTPYSIKNSYEMINHLKNLSIPEDEIMISFDVTSLFTNVPITETLKYTRELLQKDNHLHQRTMLSVDDIIEGMEICLRCTYFKFRNQTYEQMDGVAMGCPLSTIGADIFMEKLEDAIIHNNPMVNSYKRYVDDSFCNAKSSDITLIQAELNSFHPQIQFTCETEKEGKLPFLDILISRDENKSLSFSVYRKNTHTDKYLNWNSVHPNAHKITVVNTLTQRALRFCSGFELTTELQHIQNVLIERNNYPKKWINAKMKSIIQKYNTTKPNTPQDEDKPRIILPYVKGLTEPVVRIINRGLGNPIGYIPFNRMSTLTSTHKDQEKCIKCGVYIIECKCGSIYIGETGRDMKTRITEHRNKCNNQSLESGVAEHIMTNDRSHTILWDKAKLILPESRKFQRKIKEATVIHNATTSGYDLMNRKYETGCDWLHSYWKPVVNKFYKI